MDEYLQHFIYNKHTLLLDTDRTDSATVEVGEAAALAAGRKSRAKQGVVDTSGTALGPIDNPRTGDRNSKVVEEAKRSGSGGKRVSG
jgi:hypothetical protein